MAPPKIFAAPETAPVYAPVTGTRYLWLNGRIMPEYEANISPYDHGLMVGDGVFETLISYRGAPFAPTRHWQRLQRSGRALGIEVPAQAEIDAAMAAVLKANNLADARIRVTVTSGVGPLGSDKGSQNNTVLVLASPVPSFQPCVSVATVPFTRHLQGALTGHKTTSYGENVAALAYAKKRGGGEAIFADTEGRLSEGTGTNVFLVHHGRFITPPLSSGCLAGVTRALVLKICLEHDIPCEEEHLPLSALAEAEEAFITSSTREVHPIDKVDGQDLLQAPGPVTARLQALFKKMAAHNIDP